MIFIDEATQFRRSGIAFPGLPARCQWLSKRIYYLQPRRVSHNYIKRLFIDRDRDGRPDDYVFIKALVTDNRVLLDSQPDYLAQLEALHTSYARPGWRATGPSWRALSRFTDDPEHYETGGTSSRRLTWRKEAPLDDLSFV